MRSNNRISANEQLHLRQASEHILSYVQATIRAGSCHQIVAMPPGSGKTTLAHGLIAHQLIDFPETSVLYSCASFAHRLSQPIRYQIEKLGITTLDHATDDFGTTSRWKTASGSRFYSVPTLHGSPAGLRHDLIVIDGLYRSRDQAESQQHRATLANWITTHVMPRLKTNGQIVILTDPEYAAELTSVLSHQGTDWKLTSLS